MKHHLSLEGSVLEQTTSQVLKALISDSNYYGEYGRNFLSNSDIGTLLRNPMDYGKPGEMSVPMVIGGYFHTLILEPNKLEKYKIIDATSRNTKVYKEMSDGEICLLESEADRIAIMRDTLLSSKYIKGLIQDGNVEYEVPMIAEIHGEWWKGKADIINHDEKLIIDLKTTGDLERFRSSAYRYGYNSQAYIYQTLFPGYEMIFVAIDKKTLQLGIYDCSDNFLESGEQRVITAVADYRLFFNNADFDASDYFKSETL